MPTTLPANAPASAPRSQALPPAGLAPQNITQNASTGLRAELFELATGDVWLCQQAITEVLYNALEPGAAYLKPGIAKAAMDVAWFLRSPGAPAQGAVDTRTIGGLEFSRVARPLNFRGFAKGDAETQFAVEKHHVLGYHAGSTLRLVRMPDGSFLVPQSVPANGPCTRIPATGTLVEITLTQAWTVTLPCPAPVYFFNDLTSFCGGVLADQLPSEALAQSQVTP